MVMVSKVQLPSENKESVLLEIMKCKFSFIFCNKPFFNCLAGYNYDPKHLIPCKCKNVNTCTCTLQCVNV